MSRDLVRHDVANVAISYNPAMSVLERCSQLKYVFPDVVSVRHRLPSMGSVHNKHPTATICCVPHSRQCHSLLVRVQIMMALYVWMRKYDCQLRTFHGNEKDG